MCRINLWSCHLFASSPRSDFASFPLETCHRQFSASITSYSLGLALSNAHICILVVGAVCLRTCQRQVKCSCNHPSESKEGLSWRVLSYHSPTKRSWRKFTLGDAHDCVLRKGTRPLATTNLRRPSQSLFVMWWAADYTQSSFEFD